MVDERPDGGQPDLVSAVAHELKSPLAAVRGAARALERGTVDDETRLRLLHVIDDAAAQAERLIEDLLLAGRLGAGRLPVEPLACDAAEIAAEAVETARAGSGRAVEIVLDAPPAAPCRADPRRLRQALANLVANAVAHAPEGTPVRVSLGLGRGRVLISVSDEGPGIAAEDADRVFEPYVRLAEREGGSGLGLYLARTLVRAMDGDLTVDSEPGRGSTFTIEVPASPG